MSIRCGIDGARGFRCADLAAQNKVTTIFAHRDKVRLPVAALKSASYFAPSVTMRRMRPLSMKISKTALGGPFEAGGSTPDSPRRGRTALWRPPAGRAWQAPPPPPIRLLAVRADLAHKALGDDAQRAGNEVRLHADIDQAVDSRNGVRMQRWKAPNGP